jgi:hypothetical protein
MPYVHAQILQRFTGTALLTTLAAWNRTIGGAARMLLKRRWLSFLILVAAAQPQGSLMAQTLDHPFTEDELYCAFRLMKAPEAEAREAAQALVAVQRQRLLFVDDTPILLSLLSAEVHAKVERYRAALRGNAPPDPAEEAEWQRRRAELERILETDRQNDPGDPGP